MTVNSLRKNKNIRDDQAVSLAKTLIKDWKKFIAPGGGAKDSSNTGTPCASEENSRDSSEIKTDESNGSTNKQEGSQAYANHSKSEVSFPPRQVTTDAVRLKCREMLTNALKCDGVPIEDSKGSFDDLAAQLEQAIYDVRY
jgi:transcription elongation factor S-II